MRTRTVAQGACAAVLACLLVLAAPLAADAHVHVHPERAAAGADETVLTFEVPNESAAATTTGVVIELPTTGAAFGEVSYQPVPGWTARVVTTHLRTPVTVDGAEVDEVPSRVEFTTRDAGIRSGEEQEFVLSVGPVPDTGRVLLPVRQTYSDGTVVRWDEAAGSDGAEPAHPAPVLYIRDAPPAAEDGDAAAASGDAGVLPLALATGALVVALLALVVALVAVLRTRGARPGGTDA